MKELDNFYFQQNEPIRGCLLALRQIILNQDMEITTALKYGMPFFCYRGKMFCYLWVHKKHKLPYLGMVQGNRLHHPDLLIEKRSRMKIMLFQPANDLPLETIQSILLQAISFHQKSYH